MKWYVIEYKDRRGKKRKCFHLANRPEDAGCDFLASCPSGCLICSIREKVNS